MSDGVVEEVEEAVEVATAEPVVFAVTVQRQSTFPRHHCQL